MKKRPSLVPIQVWLKLRSSRVMHKHVRVITDRVLSNALETDSIQHYRCKVTDTLGAVHKDIAEEFNLAPECLVLKHGRLGELGRPDLEMSYFWEDVVEFKADVACGKCNRRVVIHKNGHAKLSRNSATEVMCDICQECANLHEELKIAPTQAEGARQLIKQSLRNVRNLVRLLQERSPVEEDYQ